MRKTITLIMTALLIITLIYSCEDDEGKVNPFTLEDDIERGAVLRTVDLQANDFELGNLNSAFQVILEEQDIKEGDLLETVEFYIRFKDNNPENGDVSTSESLFMTLDASDFDTGPQNLPRSAIDVTFAEALTATGVAADQVACKDQFLIRLNLKLTDGRNFTNSNASSIIIAFDTFFSSPFCYTINVVEPLDNDLFVGMYRMESILDGPNGPTFVDDDMVEITKGRSTTTRQFYAWHNLYHRSIERKRRWEFNVVCDEVVFGKNQLSSPEGYCIQHAAPLLLGPGIENAIVDPNDDSVFELWFVEGYLGFDGSCGFGTAPTRIRFSKQ